MKITLMKDLKLSEKKELLVKIKIKKDIVKI